MVACGVCCQRSTIFCTACAQGAVETRHRLRRELQDRVALFDVYEELCCRSQGQKLKSKKQRQKEHVVALQTYLESLIYRFCAVQDVIAAAKHRLGDRIHAAQQHVESLTLDDREVKKDTIDIESVCRNKCLALKRAFRLSTGNCSSSMLGIQVDADVAKGIQKATEENDVLNYFAVLGYTAQILQTVSQWYCIPLPVQLLLRGSKSKIGFPADLQHRPKRTAHLYPLYFYLKHPSSRVQCLDGIALLEQAVLFLIEQTGHRSSYPCSLLLHNLGSLLGGHDESK